MVFLFFSFLLFFIGFIGAILIKRYFILTLISIELILLAININFVIYSVYLDDLLGQIFSIVFLTLAASESVLGLAIVIIFFRLKGGLALDSIFFSKA
jgi:NADH:ubiquinone oxidoreductase subunit K